MTVISLTITLLPFQFFFFFFFFFFSVETQYGISKKFSEDLPKLLEVRHHT